MSGLDVEDLIDEARLTTGFDDFGGETYRDGLTRLRACLGVG